MLPCGSEMVSPKLSMPFRMMPWTFSSVLRMPGLVAKALTERTWSMSRSDRLSAGVTEMGLVSKLELLS